MSEIKKLNKKVIIIAASVLIVAILSVVGILTLKNKNSDEELVANEVVKDVVIEEDDVEVVPDVEVDETRTSEALVDKEDPSVWTFNSESFSWSVGTPIFNPIGDESLLTRLDFDELDDAEFDYYDNNLYESTRKAYGPTWCYVADIIENENDLEFNKYIRDLKRHLVSEGGVIEGVTNDGFIFSFIDQDKNHWLGEAERDRNAIAIEIVKENELKLNKKTTFNTSDYEDNHIYFSTYNLDKEFINATVEIATGILDIEIEQEILRGEYKRVMDYDKRFDAEIETRYILDDLSKDTGISYWSLSWRDNDDDPKEITIELNSLGDLVDVRYGEDFGAVLISAKYAKFINLSPVGTDHLRLVHPEYNEASTYLDKTPEGDYLVYVPAGDWNAEIYPNGDSAVNSYATGLIPVNTGEITEIIVPLSIETSLNKDLDKFLNQQGLKIDKIIDNGDQVEFDFTLVDKETKTILPTIENTQIKEGGADVEIIDITSVKTPPSVVLLLDSSGSMKGQMAATLSAAATFIEGLPDGTNIQMIDFDDEPRVLEGNTKEEAKESLKKIVVGGSTALYDSVVLGLDLLEDLERPTLVAFTDGEDENHTVPGSGSITSKEEALKIVEQSGIQVLTIGFGEGHDGTTLKEIGEAGHGLYFSADDQEALTSVFEAINEKINSTYTATYLRPTQSAPSDVPVVNIVVDISGSMDSSWDETTGYRMDKMKNLFHEFVVDLPEGTQIQLMAFNDEVFVKQMMTSDKLKILSALGELEAGGGTNILGSVDAGFRTLNAVPSSQKVMLYLTDAALGVDEGKQEQFDRTLSQIEEEQMNVLWIGLGEGLDETDFEHVALMTNGEYVISEDPNVLKEATDRLLGRMGEKKESINTSIAIQVNKTSETGLLTPYSTSELVELTPIPVVGMSELAESVNYITGKELKQYDVVSAKYLTGDSLPQESIKILKRIPLDESGSNEAASIHLTEMLYLSQLKGVEAPYGMRYIALFADMSNILPEQDVIVYPDGSGHPANWVGSSNSEGVIKKTKIPYQVPDIFSHLSLSYNNDGMYPLSTATWVANQPLVIPGQSALTIMPDETVDGALVFIVPDVAMEQISLHYYDTNYGHINMPIVGNMSTSQMEIASLPQNVETKLSDGFSITVTGKEEVLNVANMIDATTNNNFTLFDARFTSKVQANLAINPAERISLEYPTTNGSFLVPLDDVTELVPMGMLSDMIVSPGADNQVRYAFHTPIILNNNSANLFIDLSDEDAIVKATEGNIYDSNNALGSGKHDYATINVNGLFRNTEEVAGHNAGYIIADITIHDIKDGYASRGMIDNLKLVEVGHEIDEMYEEDKFEAFDRKLELALNSGGLSSFSSSNDFDYPYVVEYSNYTDDIILGFDDDTIIYDGTSRRGFVLFRINSDADFRLKSNFFEGLDVAVETSDFNYELLTQKLEYDYSHTFQNELEIAINSSIDEYKLKYPAKASSGMTKTDLDASTIDKNEILPPMISIYGSQVFENISSLEELETLVRSIEVKNSGQVDNSYMYNYYHSPEAIISQGWGTISDVTNLAMKGLTKLGYNPKKRMVELTDIGIEKLITITNETTTSIEILPALVFVKDKVEETWVIPFMETVENLQNSCFYVFDEAVEHRSDYGYLKIEYLIEPNGKNVNDQLGDIGNALSGGGSSNEPYYEEVFEEPIDYATLSLDSIDIGTTVNEEGNTPRVLTAKGALVSPYGVDATKFNILGIKISMNVQGDQLEHTTLLPEGVAIEDIFITFGINLPELSEIAFDTLLKESDKVYKDAQEPDDLSALRWSARKVINQFVAKQSEYEREMADVYGFNVGRLYQDSGIVLIQLVDKGDLVTHIDLLQITPQIFGDEEMLNERSADVQSFNMMAGLNASMLESSLLDGGYGFNEVWEAKPDGTGLVFYDFSEDYSDYRAEFEAEGYSEAMIDYFMEIDSYVVIQEKPSIINGEERWAWLETDTRTFETIGVLDTFEHGAMTSKAIIEHEKNAANYMFGAMSGVGAALWTVCGFSLEIPDYDEMKKAAFGLAYSLKDGTTAKDGGGTWDLGNTPEYQVDLGTMKIKIGRTGLSLDENFLGYSNGFTEGLAIYFSRMP